MKIKDKNIAVFGIGVTGKSSISALSYLGANVYVIDESSRDDIENALRDIDNIEYEIIDDYEKFNWSKIDLLLKSPGIKLDNKIIKFVSEKSVEIVSDIELAYRIYGGENLIAITGTNGKTTTSTLVAHILQSSGIKAKVVGNIGVGILQEIIDNGLDTTYVVETSSFQLASTKTFAPKIAAITNITPDHIDWHGSYENYIYEKKRLGYNLPETSSLVLNYDDEELMHFNFGLKCKVVYFSVKDKLDNGYYFDEDYICFGDNKIFSRKLINLVGMHNVSNTICAFAMCKLFGLNDNQIVEGIKTFSAIEHRIEPVKKIKDVWYYNDSKGTNVDSTEKAIAGFDSNIILIAGGYDKNAEYDRLFMEPWKIKSIILLGQTKFKIKDTASKYGIKSIEITDNLEEATNKAYSISSSGDVVLFSPACASWGMYKNYEERGRHFKEIVNNIYEKDKKETSTI